MSTTDGHLACIDVSEAAIQATQTGTLPSARQIKARAPVTTPTPTALETASSASGGIILECFREEGRLRMRVISPGYDSNLRVQFPQNIREERARYIVDEFRTVAHGGFYRTFGNIRRLID